MKHSSKDYSYCTYILLCSDKTYYVGITNDIHRRFQEHQTRYNPNSYSAKRLPVSLIHFEYYSYVWNAIAREKQLKKWIRNKKAAIIENDIQKLKSLSKRNQKFTLVTKTRWNVRRKLLRRVGVTLSS
jgi:putative endonuclease